MTHKFNKSQNSVIEMSVSNLLQLLLNERNRATSNDNREVVDSNVHNQSSKEPEAGVHSSSNPFFSGNGMNEEKNNLFNVESFQKQQLNNPK